MRKCYLLLLASLFSFVAYSQPTYDIEWHDLNNDGNIETLRFIFSEQVIVFDDDPGGFDAIVLTGGGVTMEVDNYNGVYDNITSFLDLTVSGVSGTASPTGVSVSYDMANSSGSLIRATAAPGNEVSDGEAPGTASDKASPIIIEMEIKDTGTVDGKIDEVVLVWSENVDTDDGNTPVFEDIGFVVLPDGSGILNASQFSSISDPAGISNSVTISGVTSQSDINTSIGLTGISLMTSGGWVDAASNASVANFVDASETVKDSSAPIIKQATTSDSDNDGFIDRVLITFSENIDDSESNISSIDVQGASYVNEIEVATIEDDGSVVISFDEQSGNNYDTDVTPAISVGASDVKDAEGNFTAFTFTNTSDAAKPIITSFEYKDINADARIDQVELTFSEPLHSSSILAKNDLFFSNNGGFTGAAFGADATNLLGGGGESTLTVSLETPATAELTKANGSMTISTQGSFSLSDGTNINSILTSQNQATYIDGAVPILLEKKYLDTDIDGKVDRIDLTYSESLGSSSYDNADWSLPTNPEGLSIVSGSLVDNDVRITVSNAPSNSTHLDDTEIVYTNNSNNLTDGENVVSSSINLLLDDGAAPILTSAITLDNDSNGEIDRLELTFSEPIDDSESGPFNISTVDVDTFSDESKASADDDNEKVLVSFTESGNPDTNVTPDLTIFSGQVRDEDGNSLATDQNFSNTVDMAPPVIYDYTMQTSNAYLHVVFSENIRRVGGGGIVLTDFNENTTGTVEAISINIDAVEDANGDPLGSVINQAFFALSVDLPIGDYNDPGDYVNIDSDGTTLEDEADNLLSDTQSTGNVALNDILNFPKVLSSTWVTTSTSPLKGYIELTFDEGLYRDNTTDRSPLLANSNNNGSIKIGDFTNGSSLCDEDELCLTYSDNGSGVSINTNDGDDIEFNQSDGTLLTSSSDYSGTVYRIQLNDISDEFTGVETYTFSPLSGTQIRGRSTDAFIPTSYSHVFTMPDLTLPIVTVNPATPNSSTFTLTGTISDPEATVVVKIDGDTYVANNLGTTWSVDVSVSKTGTLEVEVSAFDAAGNEGVDSTSDEVTIDPSDGIQLTIPSISVCTGEDYVLLGDVVITETNPDDIKGSGSVLLKLPDNFSFNTSATVNFNVAGPADDFSIAHSYIGNSILVLDFTVAGLDDIDILTIEGLEIASSTVQPSEDMIRIGGTANLFGLNETGTGTAPFAQVASLSLPTQITSLDETTDPQNNITQLSKRINETFSLSAADEASGFVKWYLETYDDTPDLLGNIKDQLSFPNTEGLYTYYVTDGNGLCDSEPLKFHLLRFNDQNPLLEQTFVNKTVSVAAAIEEIYLSNPANHSVTVSGAAVTVTNPSDPVLKVLFDPEIAGVGVHEVTYQVTNDLSGEEMSESINITVNAQVEFFNQTEKELCEDDLPRSYTIDPSTYGPNPLINIQFSQLLFREWMNTTGVVPTHQVFASDIGASYPWSVSFDFQLTDLSPVSEVQEGTGVQDGEATAILIGRRSQNPDFTSFWEWDYTYFYGNPLVSIVNLGTSYCRDDAAVLLQRNLKYVSGFEPVDDSNPISRMVREYDTETGEDITQGYKLYKQTVPFPPTYTLYKDFTSDGPDGISNYFDPADPDQDGNTDEEESGNYRIVYETEELTPANCTGTVSFDLTVEAPTTSPVLNSTTLNDGGSIGFLNNPSPDDFIDGDEYLLEYCVGSVLSQFVVDGPGTTKWYDQDFNLKTTGGSFSAGAGGLGLLLNGTNQLTAEQSEVFYITSTNATGCESDYRKVSVEVYDVPQAPEPDFASWPADIKSGNNYSLDYCVPNGGGPLTPDNIVLDDLEPGESYTIEVTSFDASEGNFIGPSITILDDDGSASIDVPDIDVGDTHFYQIRKSENINENGFSSFEGCISGITVIEIFGRGGPAAPGETDFNSGAYDSSDGGSMRFHICEGETLNNIIHSFIDDTDAYTWYQEMTAINQIGSPLTPGDAMTQPILETVGFDSDIPGLYEYFVTKTNNVIDSRSFPGCESTTFKVVIEVHGTPTLPSISSAELTDLSPDPNLYSYAVCLDDLNPNSSMAANSSFTGTKEFVWYKVDDINGNNPEELDISDEMTFEELGIGNITSSQTRYFEVTQRTDIEDFPNTTDRCESPNGAIIEVVFSDQDALVFTEIFNEEDSNNNQFCFTDEEITLNVKVGPITPDPMDLSYTIDTGVIPDGTGNPTIDMDFWHQSAGGSEIGGSPTSHIISIAYQDPITGCEAQTSTTITINPKPSIRFELDGNADDGLEFCYDAPLIEIEGLNNETNLGLPENTGVFTINTGGLGITSNNRVFFDPSSAHDSFHGGTNPFGSQSEHEISFEYTDQYGCQHMVTKTVYINPRPEIIGGQIQTGSTCAESDITLSLALPEAEDLADYTFEWLVNGLSTETNVGDNIFTVDIASSANIEAIVTNMITGCVDNVSQVITVGQPPSPSISWVGITKGRNTDFVINQENPGLDDSNVSRVFFEVEGEMTSEYTTPGDIIAFPITLGHSFSDPGIYNLNLTIETTTGCSETISRQINIIDHLTSFNGNLPYEESFEGGLGQWSIEYVSLDGKSDDLVSTWSRESDIPDSEGIDGNFAIVTDNYEPNEISFVYSPSFDLSDFTSPTISMLRLVQFETFRDGVAFQFSTDDGRSWQNVGTYSAEFGSTPGWYNRDGISAGPGEHAPGIATAINPPQAGWTDQKSNQWEEAFSPIEVATDESQYVRFRFALAAQAGIKSTSGFGFDRIRIYDRDKIVLVEQFSSSLHSNSVVANKDIESNVAFSGNDILRINYFTDLYNSDDQEDYLNGRNVVDPGAKVIFYDVKNVPSVAVSGIKREVSPEENDYLKPLEAALQNAKLENPLFDISIEGTISAENFLSIQTDFESRFNFDSNSELALHIAVLEPEIVLTEQMGEYQAGDRVYNVLRKMLPDAAGFYVKGPVEEGATLELHDTWEITNLSNPDTLVAIAYVQNLNTKEIYQARALGLGGADNALGLIDDSKMVAFPNPGNEYVIIQFEDGFLDDSISEWTIYDQVGKAVQGGHMEKGVNSLRISTQAFPDGVYFFYISNERKRKSKRLIIKH